MMNRRAFTLIELLISVAIIAVLMGILLPSLSSARENAKKTLCASNLRQLGIASLLYLDENNQKYWNYFSVIPNDTTNRIWWFGYGPISGVNRLLDKSRSPLAPYTGDLAKTLQCPNFPYWHGSYSHKFALPAASYAYNITLGPSLTVPAETKSKNAYANRCGDVVLFVDGVHFDFGTTFNEGNYLQYQANTSVASGYAHFRHAGHAQLVFLDAHVDEQTLHGAAYPKNFMGPAGNLYDSRGYQFIYGGALPNGE